MRGGNSGFFQLWQKGFFSKEGATVVKFHFTNSKTKRKTFFLLKRLQQNIKFQSLDGTNVSPYFPHQTSMLVYVLEGENSSLHMLKVNEVFKDVQQRMSFIPVKAEI